MKHKVLCAWLSLSLTTLANAATYYVVSVAEDSWDEHRTPGLV